LKRLSMHRRDLHLGRDAPASRHGWGSHHAGAEALAVFHRM